MKDSWSEGSRFYTQVWAFDDMKDFRSKAHGFRCYKQLRVVVDINDFKLWAKGLRYYEQLRFMDDMIELGSRELKLLGVINR